MIIHFPHLGLNLKIAAVNQIPTKFSSIHYRSPTPSRKAVEGKKKTNKPSLLKRKKELRIIVSIRENLARCSASGALKYLPISCCILLFPVSNDIFTDQRSRRVRSANKRGAFKRVTGLREIEFSRIEFRGNNRPESVGRNCWKRREGER